MMITSAKERPLPGAGQGGSVRQVEVYADSNLPQSGSLKWGKFPLKYTISR
jgi:hypothetical protein